MSTTSYEEKLSMHQKIIKRVQVHLKEEQNKLSDTHIDRKMYKYCIYLSELHSITPSSSKDLSTAQNHIQSFIRRVLPSDIQDNKEVEEDDEVEIDDDVNSDMIKRVPMSKQTTHTSQMIQSAYWDDLSSDDGPEIVLEQSKTKNPTSSSTIAAEITYFIKIISMLQCIKEMTFNPNDQNSVLNNFCQRELDSLFSIPVEGIENKYEMILPIYTSICSPQIMLLKQEYDRMTLYSFFTAFIQSFKNLFFNIWSDKANAFHHSTENQFKKILKDPTNNNILEEQEIQTLLKEHRAKFWSSSPHPTSLTNLYKDSEAKTLVSRKDS